MTDHSAPVTLFAAKMLQDIEKIAKERDEADVRKVFAEMMTVYGLVISNLPCTEAELPAHLETALNGYIMATSLLPFEGEALLERLTESVKLYQMVEHAARNGDSIAVVDDFAEHPKIEYCFMPGTLTEIQEEARDAREKKARRKQEIYASAANSNTAGTQASQPAPVS